jgi:alcohol dehydrogenase (cytochrome c)
MERKLLPALLLSAGMLSPLALQAHDRGQGHARPSAADLADCCTPGDHDFPKVGGNLGNQNYTRLQQINKGQVHAGKLGAAWVNRIEGGLASGTNQSTTVVVDGVIYIESALGNLVAVDGKTGVTKWKYVNPFGTITRRGVAVAKDLGLVYTLGNDNRLIALNKDTGALAWVKQYATNANDPAYVGNIEKVALVYHD